MTPGEAFAICEATVRRADPDRYFAALFAPTAKRPLLHVLYAFNHELARAGETACDPLATEIRLQWWQDALGAARAGRPPAHPVAVGLAEFLSGDGTDAANLETLVEARIMESSPAPFSTLAAMEAHALATSATLMRMAASAITGMCESAAAIDEAGIAYGLTGMLRSFHFHARRGKILLPTGLLVPESPSAAEILHGKHSAKLKRALDQVGTRAMDHFQRARQNAVSVGLISAILPASLVPAYLTRVGKNFNGTDVSRLRKQLIMLRAALRGRL